MLLSGLNCPYVLEWQVIYEDIITVLATMYAYTKFNGNLDRTVSKLTFHELITKLEMSHQSCDFAIFELELDPRFRQFTSFVPDAAFVLLVSHAAISLPFYIGHNILLMCVFGTFFNRSFDAFG